MGKSLLLTQEMERKKRAVTAAAVFALAALPIFFAPFPPSTDLPQHIAQVRLLTSALGDPGGPYIVQWAGPNNLIYVFIYLFWRILPFGLVARAVLLFIVLLWICAIHSFSAVKSRAQDMTVLASILIFNQAFYWGFLNFLIGFPIFVVWFVLSTKDTMSPSWKRYAALGATSFLLYGSHALWLAAGGAWLVVISLYKKIPVRAFIFRLATLVPIGIVAWQWYPHLSISREAAGFDVAPHWAPLLDRLSSLMNATFSGVSGPAETLAFIFVYFWVALSVWKNRKRLKALVDRNLIAAGGFFLIISLLAPDKYMNTIFFSSRWFPVALIFILLALPSPAPDGRLIKVALAALVTAFFLTTASAWRRFDSEDLSGFKECLDRLPAGCRVLGLDLVKDSSVVKGRPFLQLFAYAQVFKGCELNFSFAEHYSGLVAYKVRRDVPWTPALEWFPELVKKSDFGFFDYVLVNGAASDHKVIMSFRELSPATRSGRWRLYQVQEKDQRN